MEVLDGQQRLATIRDFLHNQFAIDGYATPPDLRIEALNGKFYRSLDPATRRNIDQYALRCFRITDYLPDEPNELFYRLNQPTMLTAGEQRNALYGPAREQLKHAVKRFEELGNDKSTIGFSNARLAYDDIFARLLYFLEIRNIGIKSTESLISERFRRRDPFPDNVVARSQRSIDLFSNARALAPSWRFNKASLLSWLLFFARFMEQEPVLEFMRIFSDPKTASSGKNFVSDAIAVFQNRASLRVTDVSSVIYRDVSLWYAYSFFSDSELPHPIAREKLSVIFDIMNERDDSNFEYVLSQVVDLEQWGRLL